ncbi:hypothetical protein CEW46_24655 [Bacillus cereus]|nr:hypothetical protein CEW46_24655 [Bacillus cereus]
MSNSRVSQLESDIKKYAQSYYEGDALISDEQFDSLVDELRAIDETNPILSKVGWGQEVDNISKKVKHKYGVVGSLGKVKSAEAVDKTFGDEIKTGTPKIDGISGVAYYVNGHFDVGVSRGDGTVGQDISDKIRSKVPQYVEGFTGAVRGEFYLSLSNWKKYYSDNPSPRNVAAGVCNRNEVSDEELSRFGFIVYKVTAIESLAGDDIDFFRSKYQTLSWLKKVGFDTVTKHNIARNVKLTPELVTEQINASIEDYDIPLDGWVITKDAISIGDIIGDSGIIKYKEVAYKVEGEKAETTIKNLLWKLTRTGKLSVVAQIEPTKLSGATINRATCYNASFVKSMNLGVGAKIEIIRSGEVIPVITRTIEPVEVQLPTECPTCHTELEMVGADLRCMNSSCESRSSSRLWNWLTTVGAVDGLGAFGYSTFIEYFKVDDIKDLYLRDFNLDELRSVSGVGDSVIDGLSEMMNKIKSPIDQKAFLVGLSIKDLGGSSANKIITEVGLDAVLSEEWDKLRSIKRMNKNVISGLQDNIQLVKDLAQLVIFKEVEKVEEVDPSSIKGHFVMTGFRDKEFSAKLKELGYIEQGGVNNDTTHLLVKDKSKSSSKTKKAISLGVPIMTKDEFIDTVLGGNM